MILNHPGLAIAAVRREIMATMAQMRALGEVIAEMPGNAPPDKVANLVTKFRTAEADLARLVAMFGSPLDEDTNVFNLALLRATADADRPPMTRDGVAGSFDEPPPGWPPEAA